MEHKKNLVSYSVLFSGIFGTLICLGYGAGDNILAFMLGVLAVGGLVVYPIVLTLLNLFFLIVRVKNPVLVRQAKYIEYITLVLGVLYTVLILPFFGDSAESRLDRNIGQSAGTYTRVGGRAAHDFSFGMSGDGGVFVFVLGKYL